MRSTFALVLVGVLIVAPAVLAIQFDDHSEEHCQEELKCAAKGKACTHDFYSAPTTNGTTCKYPLYCSNGKCVDSNEDTACTKNEDCYSSYYGFGNARCVYGHCKDLGNTGDSCSNTTDCFNGMPCVKGTCKGFKEATATENATACLSPRLTHPPAIFYGVSLKHLVGFSCIYPAVCVPLQGWSAIGFEHLNGTCQSVLDKAGANCSTGAKPCGAGLVCNAGECIAALSLPAGAACDVKFVSLGSIGPCAAGLVCAPNKTCVAGYKPVLPECEKDSECPNGKCSCDPATGDSVCEPDFGVADCEEERHAADICLADNKCGLLYTQNDGSCAQAKCLNAINTVYACKSVCGTFRTLLGDKCTDETMLVNCPLIPVWAKILIAFSILFIIVLALGIAYALWSKFHKKGYANLPETK